MRASAEASLGEVAVHAEDLISLWVVVLLQPDTHVSNVLTLAVLPASSEDVVDREKLQASFTATSTSTFPVMRENLALDSLQSLAITSPRSIAMCCAIRIARLLDGLCATLRQAQTGLLATNGHVTAVDSLQLTVSGAQTLSFFSRPRALAAESGGSMRTIPH